MTMIEPTSRLADLVTANPALARELERRGLDYCCGGSRTLAQACATRALDADVVVQGWLPPATGGRAKRGRRMTPSSSSSTSKRAITATSGTSCRA
jgi:iron-sulfur cluster repair protein YtfE (RIC family)